MVKTKLMETISRLLGSKQVMATKIGDLDKNRFLVGSLLGKFLVLDDDVKAGTCIPDGELKKLSEAKKLTGENKYGPPFEFICRAVPIMSCNNMISLGDISYGMRRRLMIIPFDRCFEEHEDDKLLFPRIWKSEMSGVLNLALAGLKRIHSRKLSFETPGTIKAAKKQWIRSASPVPAFLKDCCVEEAGCICSLQELYKCFSDWCEDSGLTHIQHRGTFTRNLEHMGFKRATKSNKGVRFQGLMPKK